MSDQDIILDSHAALAGEINSRLDGDDHSRAKLFFAAGFSHDGQLVNFAADAMAEAVAELFAVAGFFDHVAGDAIGLHGGHAGAQKLDGGLLRVEHDLIDLLHFVRDAADHQSSGEI